MQSKQELLRELPQVDEVLKQEAVLALSEDFPREILVDAVREKISSLRERILADEITSLENPVTDIAESVVEKLNNCSCESLISLINATGVVLHTNLGRSLLCKNAVKEINKVASSYSDLEYDIEQGVRGSRHTHLEKALKELTGAEDAMVVNNNAAATLLVLSALGKDREIVTSRGELVEIGGSFRIPEIMEQGGAILKEVGTTNRTRKKDYTRAYKEGKTAAFLKVHTSNYRVVGFTEEVSIEELAELAHERNIPAIYDLGSGLFFDLSKYGIEEPNITKILKSGADIILFSGDKLLGGPQAGIIVGKKEYIDMCKSHPLARALRVDKMTIAALCATLYEYRDTKTALTRVPTLRMITYSQEELERKANSLAEKLRKETSFTVNVETCDDQVGGGSAPCNYLKGYMVTVSSSDLNVEDAEAKLRKGKRPVICRINHNSLCFSVRTVQDGEEDCIVQAVKEL